jgi:hypothetical protein
MEDNKKAKAAQEKIGGEVNESEMCESGERGESEKRDGMECGDVVSGEGEASGGGMGGSGKASGLGRDDGDGQMRGIKKNRGL